MGGELRGKVILLAAFLACCSCLEIPMNTPKTEAPGCGDEQCSANPKAKLSSPVSNNEVTDRGIIDDVIVDKGPEYSAPLPALKRQPTKEELEAHHNQLEEQLRQDEHPDEPPKHVLERWGFFDTPTFGQLDLKRDKEYSSGIAAFEDMIKDEKKLTKRDKENINAELEKFLEEDHNYQVWSAHVYKQEQKKRRKRGIPESEIHSYFDMPNPYYQGNK